MLISDKHRALYREYYAKRTDIDSRPNVWLPRIEQLATHLGASSILDYGSGAARGISRFSNFDVVDYDPGVPGCDTPPEPADLVVSIHAIEHVEPEHLADVFEHMQSLARLAVLVVISCEPSTKLLPDGTPWHTIVRPPAWWREALPTYVEVPTIKEPDKEFAAVWRPQSWRTRP